MDVFSEILSAVKLHGAMFFNAEFSSPWGFSTPASSTMVPMLAPGAPHLLLYHFLVAGEALVQLTDGQSVELKAGDVVVFPRGDPHVISSVKGAGRLFPTTGSRRRSSHTTCPRCARAAAAMSRGSCVGT
jgi:hypothetical protein